LQSEDANFRVKTCAMFMGAGAIVQKLALAWLPVHFFMIQG
jgi:hypothetical protein